MHKELESGERWALLDCDDVLVDYVGGFKAFLERTLKRKLNGVPSSWGMDEWIGVHKDEVRDLIFQFNDTDIGFESLKPIKGAVKGLKILRAFDFKTAIVTSSSVHPYSVERRARNVRSVFGDLIDRLHIVPLGQSKRDILMTYTNAIWVEDNVGNAAVGAELGHRAFLMPAGHNKSVHGLGVSDPGVIHVNGWKELLPEVVKLIPDVRHSIGVREASLNALVRASEETGHGSWTPRNAQSEAMKKLVEHGVVSLTQHENRKPTAELTAIGFAVLGINPNPDVPAYNTEFDI